MKKRKIVIALSVSLVLLMITIISTCSMNKEAPSFRQVKISKGDLSQTISAIGTVEPKTRLEFMPPVSGRVEEVLVSEGDIVKKGQRIGWMSSTERVALIDAARASGDDELKRWKSIYKPIPLIAAINGTLISRSVEPGQTVTTSDVIFIIADKLIVEAQVDETDVAKIKKNQRTEITLDAYPDSGFTGKVERIAYEATTEDNVTVYEVEVTPDQTPDFMKSGMSADVLFVIQEKKGVNFLPADSIQYDNEGAFVLIKKDKHPPEPVRIKTGLQDGSKVEVIGEIDSNAEILVPSISIGKADDENSSANPFMPQPPHKKNKKSNARK